MTAGPTRTAGRRMRAAWQSGPLAVRSFRLLAVGQLTSTVGDYCYAVALPWLVLSTHGGPVLLGGVLACYGVPRTVLIPVGGLLTDRIGARTAMLVADVVRCVLVAGLALLAAHHIVTLATLGPLAAIIGAGEGLYIPSSSTILPSLLEPRQIAAGNGVSLAAIRTGSLLGPALGGALVAAVGSGPAFAVDAGSFAVSALSLALMPRRPRRPAPAEPSGSAGAEPSGSAGAEPSGSARAPDDAISRLGAFDLLRRSRAMQVFAVVTIVSNLTGGGLADVALPALAHARYGAGGYGALLACLAAGGLTGTLLGARTGNLRVPAIVAALSYVLSEAAMCLVPYLGGEAGAAAALFVYGASTWLGNTIFFTAAHRWTPPHVMGRVMALMMTCTFGAYPASVALTGVLVHHLGPTVFFPIAGVITGLAFLGGLTQQEYRDFGIVQPDGTYLLAGLKGFDRTAIARPASDTEAAGR
ncbi:MAG TPA: MFS transporter [Streptosporangiaceae bacterium]|nr:MFS transporter [Streptosporangiaceae bacterium]